MEGSEENMDTGLGVSSQENQVQGFLASRDDEICLLCRNLKMYPESTELEGILMLRIDAPLFFANVESVKYAIRKNENKYIQRGRQFEFVILDLSPVTDIDASAIHFLKVSPSFTFLLFFLRLSVVA